MMAAVPPPLTPARAPFDFAQGERAPRPPHFERLILSEVEGRGGASYGLAAGRF
jgi:hypothetical protein